MHVVVHNAVGVDGRIDGFVPDIALYYDLARTWDVGAHLVGSDTLVEGEATAGGVPEGGADPTNEATDGEGWDESPLLVVTDSRGRERDWSASATPRTGATCWSSAPRRRPRKFLATLDETARRSSSTVAVRSAAHYSGPAWSTR
jgi:hypothetical protein